MHKPNRKQTKIYEKRLYNYEVRYRCVATLLHKVTLLAYHYHAPLHHYRTVLVNSALASFIIIRIFSNRLCGVICSYQTNNLMRWEEYMLIAQLLILQSSLNKGTAVYCNFNVRKTQEYNFSFFSMLTIWNKWFNNKSITTHKSNTLFPLLYDNKTPMD